MKKALLSFCTLCFVLATSAQQNCFDEYSGTYNLRGGKEVPDGMHRVIVAVKDSNNKAQCSEGKIVVRNDSIVPPLYVLRENGSYTETYGKFDYMFYRQTLGHVNFIINKAMSAEFMLTKSRHGRIFFPEYVNPNPGGVVAAPPIGNAKKQPATEDLSMIQTTAKAIQFENGKAVITPESYATLDAIATTMIKYPDTKWTIDGHTDNVGNVGTNYTLSKKRAQAVEDYLIAKGVKAENLFAAGHGADDPIADNATAEGKKINRRVEIKAI